MAKKTVRKKHVPQRTCVGCRKVFAKRSLTRIVRTPQGVMIDSTGKLAGRGAYLHDQISCWKRGLDGALAHALKSELTEGEIESFLAYMDTLPQEASHGDQKDGE